MSASVFPARAGMSPVQLYEPVNAVCVPRASGDEPEPAHQKTTAEVCSPRERG